MVMKNVEKGFCYIYFVIVRAEFKISVTISVVELLNNNAIPDTTVTITNLDTNEVTSGTSDAGGSVTLQVSKPSSHVAAVRQTYLFNCGEPKIQGSSLWLRKLYTRGELVHSRKAEHEENTFTKLLITC